MKIMNNKSMIFLKTKGKYIITILNIFVMLFIFLIILHSQKYTFLLCHDYFLPFNDFIRNRTFTKAFCCLFNNILPNFFNINPNDFRSGFSFGCLFLCFVSFVITILFSLSFFISRSKIFEIFTKKEFLFIFPLSYIFINFPINNIDNYFRNYFRMEDLAYTADYFFVYLFFFSFVLILYRIVFHQYKPKNISLKILYILISLDLGMHIELFSVTTILFIFTFSIIIYFLDKKLLKNKTILLLFIPYLLGLFIYYILQNKFMANFYHYGTTISATISNGFVNIKEFITQFYITMFLQKFVFYIVFVLLLILLYLKKNKETSYICVFSISILFGYLLANFLTIFTVGIYQHESYYMFQREHFDIIYTNILEFCILMLLGKFYELSNKKTLIISIVLTFLTLLSIVFFNQYNKIQNLKFNIKTVVYNVDKFNIIYSILGESSILPSGLILPDYTGIGVFHLENNYYYKNKEKINNKECVNSKYFNQEYFGYTDYFNNIYKTKFIGAIFKDNETAKIEIEKRLALFDDTLDTIDDLKRNRVKFTNMYHKYKNKNLTLNDIKQLELNRGKSPILDKAKAYIFYENEDYDKSIKLYEEYLKTNNNDIDALLNLARMYEIKNKYKEAEEKYIKLLKIDDENLIFLFELLEIYFYKTNDYNMALEICNKMINIIDNMPALYINKAIIYSIIGDLKEANNQLYIAIKLNPVFTQNKLKELGIKGLSDIKKENVELIFPVY